MKEQGSGVRGQGPIESVERICGTCGHWQFSEEDLDQQIGTGDCTSQISPNESMQMLDDDTCDFWKEIPE